MLLLGVDIVPRRRLHKLRCGSRHSPLPCTPPTTVAVQGGRRSSGRRRRGRPIVRRPFSGSGRRRRRVEGSSGNDVCWTATCWRPFDCTAAGTAAVHHVVHTWRRRQGYPGIPLPLLLLRYCHYIVTAAVTSTIWAILRCLGCRRSVTSVGHPAHSIRRTAAPFTLSNQASSSSTTSGRRRCCRRRRRRGGGGEHGGGHKGAEDAGGVGGVRRGGFGVQPSGGGVVLEHVRHAPARLEAHVEVVTPVHRPRGGVAVGQRTVGVQLRERAAPAPARTAAASTPAPATAAAPLPHFAQVQVRQDPAPRLHQVQEARQPQHGVARDVRLEKHEVGLAHKGRRFQQVGPLQVQNALFPVLAGLTVPDPKQLPLHHLGHLEPRNEVHGCRRRGRGRRRGTVAAALARRRRSIAVAVAIVVAATSVHAVHPHHLHQPQRRGLRFAVALQTQLHAVHERQVGALQEHLHHHLPRAHAQVQQAVTVGAARVQVLAVQGPVHASRQQLAVQKRPFRGPRHGLVLLRHARVALGAVPRLLDLVPVHAVDGGLGFGVVQGDLLAVRPLVDGRQHTSVKPAAHTAFGETASCCVCPPVVALAVVELLLCLLGLRVVRLLGPLHNVEGRLEHGQPALLVHHVELDAVLTRLVILRHHAVLPVSAI
mmetsp:Transcript_21540/g.39250  ORF Transcript_21540/g.39250 Transcript_21540/m.39250 type:complete len:652 (+) Transcript_21540:110-2065(+)